MNNLIILGGARNVWDDLKKAPKGDIMAVGNVSMFYRKPIKYIASMHPELLPVWKELRRLHAPVWYIKEEIVTHGYPQPHQPIGGDVMWSNKDFGAKIDGTSSGCFGASVGVKLGYEKIILCGVPLSGGNFYDTSDDDFTKKHKRFEAVAKTWGGKVTSMSGWTRELLN